MKKGTLTGKIDDNGVEIKLGDNVELYEYKEGYVETCSQDGWGRSVRLCAHDQHVVDAQGKTTKGVVVYSAMFTGFVVEFDDYMLNSGRKAQNLYMLGKSINYANNTIKVV